MADIQNASRVCSAAFATGNNPPQMRTVISMISTPLSWLVCTESPREAIAKREHTPFRIPESASCCYHSATDSKKWTAGSGDRGGLMLGQAMLHDDRGEGCDAAGSVSYIRAAWC